MSGNIKKSGEDYLEAIYFISKTRNKVRSVDISAYLSVTRPSVHRAVSDLAAKGYVQKENYGDILITETGIKAAESIALKHATLHRFLADILGVSEQTAQADACKIEHDISEETLTKLIKFMNCLK